MKIDSVNNTNFQAKLVLGKTVRPQNIREFAENVRAFEDFTSRIQGTFYAEKEFGENTKRINIFYKDGNYIDSCKYTEDLFEMRTDYFKEEIQTGIKYEMISGLFQQRKDMLNGFGLHRTFEDFNRGMRTLAKRFGAEFEDLGIERKEIRVYPSFSKMEQEQEDLIGKLR